MTGTVHYQGPWAATENNLSFAPQFATLDPGVRHSTRLYRRFVTARLGAINLTDTRYFSSIGVGNISGAAGADTACLGPPRTVLASLEVDL